MKKVLIVDDEFLVRLGLKTTIDWSAHGYVIVGEAANGREALDLFDETQPDILITDIKMPVMDGLTLIKNVKKKNKTVQVVILSNYAEFSFARQAVELGVFQYMLKSEINSQNLIDLLQNLTVELQTESQAMENDPRVQQEDYVKAQIFSIPQSGRSIPFTIEPPPEGLFDNEQYAFIIHYCDISSLTQSAADMMNKALIALADTTYNNPITCTKYYKGQMFFVILSQLSGHSKLAQKELVEQCSVLARNAKHYFDVSLQGGISLPGNWQRFGRMLWEAEKARENCFFEVESYCIYQNIQIKEPENAPSVSHKKMGNFFENQDKAGAQGYIDEVFDALWSLRHYGSVKNVCIDFLAIAKSICEGLKEELPQSLDMDKFDYDNLIQLPTLESMKNYISDIYGSLFSVALGNASQYSSTIRSCINYIEENFDKNISLDDVAKAVNISKSYISMLFKQETGTNFVAYLNDYRIRQAKILLTKTNLKIYEVAEKVGFFSPYYFSKLFKELTGMNCKEFKDKYYLN